MYVDNDILFIIMHAKFLFYKRESFILHSNFRRMHLILSEHSKQCSHFYSYEYVLKILYKTVTLNSPKETDNMWWR